jgi:intracellular septation protein
VTLNPHLKRTLDFLPLAAFLAVYHFSDLFAGTAVLLVSTLAVLAFLYWAERRIEPGPLIIAVVVSILGGLTLWLHDEQFIKMKPTFIYLIFAAVLITGYFFNKGFLKYLIGAALSLTEEGWRILSLRWAFFFIGLAALNEYVWRHYPTETWVHFKVFGCMGLIGLFSLLQTRVIQRHARPDE